MGNTNMFLSKNAKVISDEPAYKKKVKTESGFKYEYDSAFLKKRWAEKKKKLALLEKNRGRLLKDCEKYLKSDDLRESAIAACVIIMAETGMRIGNEESSTAGATTLKVKHVKINGARIKFDFVGKSEVKQHQQMSNAKVVSVLKELMKGKKPNDFVFEIEKKKIWDRAINRFLKDFDISAKDLRGYKANEVMKEQLKKKDFEEALEETAKIIGHEKSTLKNQYLDPDLVKKYVKAGIEIEMIKQAGLLEDVKNWWNSMTDGDAEETPIAQTQMSGNVKTNEKILAAWKSLKPFLPAGAVLTSGVRDQTDQERIINNLWNKSGLSKEFANITDPTIRAQKLRQVGYQVANPQYTKPYGHLRGNAFDISGANLQQIAQAAYFVHNSNIPVTLHRVLIEPKNNAVHIEIQDAQYNPRMIAQVAQEADIKTSVASSIDDEIFEDEVEYDPQAVYEDLIVSDAPEEILEAFMPANIAKLASEEENWFERTPRFVDRKEVPDYEIYDVVYNLAKTDSEEFFYKGLHKKYPQLEPIALKNMLEGNAKFYFVFEYHKRDEQAFKDLLLTAAEKLSQQDVRAFFYYELHHTFPELSRGAIIQLIDTNPDTYWDLGLSADFPDYEAAAIAARDIKDPNKVEVEDLAKMLEKKEASLSNYSKIIPRTTKNSVRLKIIYYYITIIL